MKTLLTTLLLSTIFFLTLSAQEKSADDLIIEGIYQEEVLGNLDKAAELFSQVLKNFSKDRGECAQAMYHLGLVAEKKAGSQESKKAERIYGELLEKYPEVGDYAELARIRLDKIMNKNTFIDPRDGHKYKWVKIGEQTWMAENLAFMPHVNPLKKQENGIWVYDYNGYDVTEARATENYQKYGCLYDWTMAMDIPAEFANEKWLKDTINHQGICPPDWHLPTNIEWNSLERELGLPEKDIQGDSDAFYFRLKSSTNTIGKNMKSTRDWISGTHGDNSSGLSMLPAGSRRIKGKESAFSGMHSGAFFWTASELYHEYLGYIEMNALFTFNRELLSFYWDDKCDQVQRNFSSRTDGYSVRCIKNKDLYPEKTGSKIVNQTNPSFPRYEKTTFKDIEPKILFKIDEDQTVFSHINNQYFVNWNSSENQLFALEIKNFEKVFSVSTKLYRDFILFESYLIFSDGAKVYSYSLESGQKNWAVELKGAILTPNSNGSHIISTIRSQTIVCLDFNSGELLWEYLVPDQSKCSPPVEGVDNIFFGLHNTIGKSGGAVYPIFMALDKATGEPEWEYKSIGNSYHMSPTVDDEKVLFINQNDNYLYALNQIDGTLIWRSYCDRTPRSEITASDHAYFVHETNHGIHPNYLYAISKNGERLWKKSFGSPTYNQNDHLVIGDYVCVLPYNREDHYIAIFDIQSGGKAFQLKLPTKINFMHKLADNLIVGCKDGIYIIEKPELLN